MEQPYSISLYPGTGCADGRSGDHIILAPAYSVTSEEIHQIVDITVAVIENFFLQLPQFQEDHGANVKSPTSASMRS